ncbi:MAG: TIGR02679 domain-containing protein [Blautia sp.]|nr:TIGR02679 domain-containing protein [Blautia sp.]
MEKESKQELLEKCLEYFKERPVYKKLFEKMNEKYESLGHIGGKVVLTGLNSVDKAQLGGFLQKDYTENKSITISAEAFGFCLSTSKFAGISLEELLKSYFGRELVIKKEERKKENEKKDLFFKHILDECEGNYSFQWLKNTLEEHKKGYEILIQQYNNAPEKLDGILKTVLSVAEKVLTEKEKNLIVKKELLAVFAAKTTGDPHYFDRGTTAEKLLLAVLSTYLVEEKDEELSAYERQNQIFYRAGILKDDLSNDTLVYGIRAWKQDGSLHEGIEGFLHEKEPIRLTLRTIGNLKDVCAEQQNIYVFENPSVFAAFVKKYPKCSAVCVNGQPRLATFLLLDFLKEQHIFYYNGDFDPEGFLIAQRLKERYEKSCYLWKYEVKWYKKYISNVELSEARIKKLEKVYLPELQELKVCMQETKKAAYQETMLDILEQREV